MHRKHYLRGYHGAIAVERRPSVAARLHAAERALADPDPLSGTRPSGEAAEIVQAAYQVGSLEPGAAQAAQERCARRAPGAGSARTPPDAPATAARAQRIRSIAVSGYSP